jgi:hypothetical protein
MLRVPLARASSNCNDRPILTSEGMLLKVYESKHSVEKMIAGLECQGARHQDELIGGKPPVIK